MLSSVTLIFVLTSAIASSQLLPQPLPLPHPEHEKYDAEVARIDAAQMIGAGKLTILVAGLPPPCEYLLQQKIYRKYGIHWTTTGDVVTDGFEDYRESFNEVMVRHISRQRGEDFLASLDKKVAVEAHLKCAPRSRKLYQGGDAAPVDPDKGVEVGSQDTRNLQVARWHRIRRVAINE